MKVLLVAYRTSSQHSLFKNRPKALKEVDSILDSTYMKKNSTSLLPQSMRQYYVIMMKLLQFKDEFYRFESFSYWISEDVWTGFVAHRSFQKDSPTPRFQTHIEDP